MKPEENLENDKAINEAIQNDGACAFASIRKPSRKHFRSKRLPAKHPIFVHQVISNWLQA